MVSVIVCTHNRSRCLVGTLEKLIAQEGAGAYEIIVVDNASADDTAARTKEFSAKHPDRIKYVFETKLGQSAARNRGILESRGDTVAFTDDDVLVSGDWIRRIRDGLLSPGTDGVFGKVLPVWEAEPPEWILEDRRLQRCLALMDLGDKVLVARARGEQFFGLNFALTREAMERVGLFDESLGDRGKIPYGGEDTDMYLRLLEADCRLVYDPRMVIFHRVPPNRMTEAYFRSWYFAHGAGVFRRAAMRKGGAGRFSERAYALREFFATWTGFMTALFRRDPKERRYYGWKLIGILGGLAAVLRLK